MPIAMEVHPEKWSEIAVLFDDGEYSVIAGAYDGTSRRLGERWNGDGEHPLGFPNVAGYPVWHVVPTFLEGPILHAILEELARNPGGQIGNNAPDAVLRELRTVVAERERRVGAGE